MFLLHASDEVVLRLTLPSLSYGFYNHNNNISDKDDDESEDEFDDDFDAGNNVKKVDCLRLFNFTKSSTSCYLVTVINIYLLN